MHEQTPMKIKVLPSKCHPEKMALKPLQPCFCHIVVYMKFSQFLTYTFTLSQLNNWSNIFFLPFFPHQAKVLTEIAEIFKDRSAYNFSLHCITTRCIVTRNQQAVSSSPVGCGVGLFCF